MNDLDQLSKSISHTPAEFVQIGDRYVDNLPIAIKYYQQAINLDPNFVLAYERLGTVYQVQNQPMEAITNFSHAIAIHPQSLTAQLGLGNAYEQMGWHELAIAHWQTALSLAPERFLAEDHCRLGDHLTQRGRIAEAMQSYEQAIATNPNQIMGYRALFKLQQQIDPNPVLIEAIFERAITQSPDRNLWEAKDYNLLGMLWMQKIDAISHQISDQMSSQLESEQTDQSVDAINQASSDRHTNFQRLKSLQESYLSKAIAHLEYAIQIDPSYADAHCNLGSAYLHQGRSKDAILAYREAIDIDPNFATPYLNLGIHLSSIGKIDEAIACLESAIELDPQSLQAKTYLSKILEHQISKNPN
ncbi:MAG: tetratricopeptide repeat protein [Pseudanabaenaceae cyanobacterium bins.39]|nr:tetratricopeptide repeat protein [Pseudanabaenaceae cyanobacterium bins.39]